MGFVENFIKNPVKVTVFVILLVMFGLIVIVSDADPAHPRRADSHAHDRDVLARRQPSGNRKGDHQRAGGAAQRRRGRDQDVEREHGLARQITLEFAVGTNLDAAITTVNARLQQVREYPIEADKPVITASNAANQPIAWFILNQRLPSADDFDAFAAKHPDLATPLERIEDTENPGLALFRLRELAEKHPEAKGLLPPPVNLNHYRRFAEDVIEARFEKVPGVSQSNVFGGEEDELQVIVNPGAARRAATDDRRCSPRSGRSRISTFPGAIFGKASGAGSSARWAASAIPSRSPTR